MPVEAKRGHQLCWSWSHKAVVNVSAELNSGPPQDLYVFLTIKLSLQPLQHSWDVPGLQYPINFCWPNSFPNFFLSPGLLLAFRSCASCNGTLHISIFKPCYTEYPDAEQTNTSGPRLKVLRNQIPNALCWLYSLLNKMLENLLDTIPDSQSGETSWQDLAISHKLMFFPSSLLQTLNPLLKFDNTFEE